MFFFRKLFFQLSIFIGFVILPFGFLYAQSDANSPYIPNIIPPTPNAAALMKFTDVPVSPYTGTSDITVPVYTIQAKGITVPVSLSYHTGGIKLKEEASWVGLGWALNAGGMISRTIVGHDDFGSDGIYYLTTAVPQLQGDLVYPQPPQTLDGRFISINLFDFFCDYLVGTSTGTENFSSAFDYGQDTYDMEPDIFSYNFPGHSGKFILTRTGTVVMQKQENIKIQFQGTTSNVTFTITDDQGNKFYFNVLEQTRYAGKNPQISSWLLSKIVTEQQDSVIFNYSTGGATTSTAPDYFQNSGNFCTAIQGTTTQYGNVPLYYNQTLQSIDFTNGHLQFAFDSTRSDLLNSYKLDSLLIYSKNSAGIQSYIKQENFYYSYFNSTYLTTNYAEFYRLKLDSVKEKSGNNSLPPYSFNYNNINPGLGSDKHSYNVDHWGYYNGVDNSQKGLIPTMTLIYNPIVNEISPYPIVLNYPSLGSSGANRQPSFPSMQTFSLQQITYPTGGKTLLNYQANDYDYNNSIAGSPDPFVFVQTINIDPQFVITHHGYTTGTIDLTNIFPVIPSATGNNLTINIGYRYLTTTNTAYSGPPTGRITFTIGGVNSDITSAHCQAGTNICTISFPENFNPGIYTWTAYIDASVDTVNTFAGIYADMAFTETQQGYNQIQNNNYVMPASGLRIQSITNYKDANTIASEKVYGYTYSSDKLGTGQPQQYTYGRIMSMPCYARYQITTTTAGGYCTGMFLSSSSIISLTSSNQGNIVGYDQVTETSIDPQTGQDIGQTVYKYFNSPDSTIWFAGYRMPGVFNMGNNLNGLLLSKVNYADVNGIYNKVDEIDYSYHTTNRLVYFSPKYQYFQRVGGILPGDCTGDTLANTQAVAWFYPSIKSERVLLDYTNKVFYQQGDPTKSVTSTANNYYDNPVHYQVTRTKTIDSKGNTLFTVLKYPQDYSSNGLPNTGNNMIDSMIGRNMISETIEKRDSLIYNGSPTGYIHRAQLSLYRQLGTSLPIVPDKIYKLDVQSPVTNFQPVYFSGNTINLIAEIG